MEEIKEIIVILSVMLRVRPSRRNLSYYFEFVKEGHFISARKADLSYTLT
jgi:hypothetical protein